MLQECELITVQQPIGLEVSLIMLYRHTICYSTVFLLPEKKKHLFILVEVMDKMRVSKQRLGRCSHLQLLM